MNESVAALALIVLSSVGVSAQTDIVRQPGPLNIGQMEIPEEFVLAGDFHPPSSPCDTDSAVRNLRAIFDAISSGDEARLDGLLPLIDGSSRFQWYSISAPSGHFVTYHVDELRPHFERRQLAGERIELHAAQLNRWDGASAHFGPLLITRSATDLSDGVHRVTGKAVLDCLTGRLIVMSLSHLNTEPDA